MALGHRPHSRHAPSRPIAAAGCVRWRAMREKAMGGSSGDRSDGRPRCTGGGVTAIKGTPGMSHRESGRPALPTDTAPGEVETGIEITPEMIDAGVKAVWGFDDFFDLGPSSEALLVRRVLAAALQVSSGDRSKTSQVRS